MNKKIILFISILAIVICSYYMISKATNYMSNNITQKGENMINDINIYKDTSSWELALAVRDEDAHNIEKIVKDKPELLNYQDTKYGATLLLWAVGMEKYKSAETLLKCGADPNIDSTIDGETPLFRAAGYS